MGGGGETRLVLSAASGRPYVGWATAHCVALTITLGPCLNYASP
jgi:hypothetical protein